MALVPVEPMSISEVQNKTAKTLSEFSLQPDSYHQRIAYDAQMIVNNGGEHMLYQTSGMTSTYWKHPDGTGPLVSVNEKGEISQ